jgi:hypothetical protein
VAQEEKRDVLGLRLDDTDIMEIAPAILIYGRPGAGKSTDVVKAFNNSLYVCSNSTILRPYESWCEANPDIVKQLNLRTCTKPNPNFDPSKPEGDKNKKRVARSWDEHGIARKTIPSETTNAAGERVPVDTWEAVREILIRYASACSTGKCPYDGIVFDEWSEFSGRIYPQMQKKFGKNGFAAINEVKEFHRWICQIPKATARKLALVSHDDPPKYDETEGSPTRGKMQYPGGPKFPIGTLKKEVCAQFDIVLHLEVTDGGMDGGIKRRYATEVHPLWERKFRDFRVSADEAVDLYGLLKRAGYLV